jgi:hypothetical protein
MLRDGPMLYISSGFIYRFAVTRPDPARGRVLVAAGFQLRPISGSSQERRIEYAMSAAPLPQRPDLSRRLTQNDGGAVQHAWLVGFELR